MITPFKKVCEYKQESYWNSSLQAEFEEMKKKVAALTKSNDFLQKENKEKDSKIEEEKRKNEKKEIEIKEKNEKIAKLEGNLSSLLRQHVGLIVECNSAKKARLQEKTEFKNDLDNIRFDFLLVFHSYFEFYLFFNRFRLTFCTKFIHLLVVGHGLHKFKHML